eukprot:6190693-Pleurochrysis_carterae.AAC.1
MITLSATLILRLGEGISCSDDTIGVQSTVASMHARELKVSQFQPREGPPERASHSKVNNRGGFFTFTYTEDVEIHSQTAAKRSPVSSEGRIATVDSEGRIKIVDSEGTGTCMGPGTDADTYTRVRSN